MGLDVKEITKPSILAHRAGVRPVAVETKRRPSDAAEGTQAHAVARRVIEPSREEESQTPSLKVDRLA